MNAKTRYFFLIYSILSNGVAQAVNLIDNHSFEDDGRQWVIQERTSMWAVAEDVDSPDIRIITDLGNTGRNSLGIKLKSNSNYRAVFASKYIKVGEDFPSRSGPLVFFFSYRGAYATQLKAKVDIRYTDGSYLFINTSPKDNSEHLFTKHCIEIPVYGTLAAVQVHFVLDQPQEVFTYVDDVSIAVATDKETNCELYLASYPVRRQSQIDFLSPALRHERHGVTLATQMTHDRMDSLIKTAERWKGPIAAAVLIFPDKPEQLSHVVQKYHSSPYLMQTTSIHLVFCDILNGGDAVSYPVNYLRNIALANIYTSHVFFVDADIIPGFSEEDAFQWRKEAEDLHRNICTELNCAFIVPTFHSTIQDVAIPNDKNELLEKLKDKKSGLEIYSGVSHGVIQYKKWTDASDPYSVDYQKDMEPYFIVNKEAPLMNQIYSGYGRDKCAYSRDIHQAGYKFIVLDKPFLVNRKDKSGTSTIYQRSKGLQLQVFLNIAFHENDLANGFQVLPSNINSRRNSRQGEYWTGFSNAKPKVCDQEQCSKPGQTTFEQPTEVLELTTINCSTKMISGGHFLEKQSNSVFPERLGKRKDMFVETLMKHYGTYTYVDLPVGVTPDVNLMIHYMHPEAVISLIPNTGHLLNIKHGESNCFHTYEGPYSADYLMKKVKTDFKGPFTYMMSLSQVDVSEEQTFEYIREVMSHATDKDIVVLDVNKLPLKKLREEMCSIHQDWEVNNLSSYLVAHKISFEQAASPLIPDPPLLINLGQRPVCNAPSKTDVVLMTKNRPLHTYAFLDSLRQFVSGINKVWIIMKSDDSENIFKEGYKYAASCFKEYFDLEIVEEQSSHGSHQFGRIFKETLERASSKYVVLGVDEIMWHRNVDLDYASCLMDSTDSLITSFQLRLGENIGIYNTIKNTEEVFKPLVFDNELLAFYPRRLPYDFGYVLNVDGTMLQRTDLIKDLGDFKFEHPGKLENYWMREHIHNSSQRWHLMYRQSRLLNNMSLKDGRVASSKVPTKEGKRLASRLVNEKEIIDIKHFAEKHSDHKSTHGGYEVKFIKSACN